MSAGEKGRFCTACSKTVVDFSHSTKSEILNYLAEHKGQKVCGRMPAEMIGRPAPVLSAEEAGRLSRFAFVLMLVFGSFLFGCKEDGVTMGEVRTVEHVKQSPDMPGTPLVKMEAKGDDTARQAVKVAEPQVRANVKKLPADVPEMILGDIIIEEQ